MNGFVVPTNANLDTCRWNAQNVEIGAPIIDDGNYCQVADEIRELMKYAHRPADAPPLNARNERAGVSLPESTK
jgi:hypothetical protein